MKIFKNTSVTKGYKNSVLAIGNFLLLKEEQKASLKENYKERYELD